ncbi:MAG: FAD-dependent oxidoreductase [Oscillospiraceae bacterium]|nr:FAD-dependent oxidoreductase [Oscillospiraceae bacterium]
MISIEIKQREHFDLVVCGGGVTGFACAVSAGRRGLKVALVERNGSLGGVATNCGVNHLLGGRKLKEDTQEHVRVVGGIFDEITDKLIAQGDAIEPNSIDLSFNPFGWYPRMASGVAFSEIALKAAMDDMCAEAGVRVFYKTDIVSVVKEGDCLKEVIVWNKAGFAALEAPYFADCTGDADVAYLAGCPFEKGRDEDGLMTPTTLEMHVENVDEEALVSYQNEHQSPKLVEIIEDLKAKGIWNFPYEIFVAIRLTEKGVFMVNTMQQYLVDGTDEVSISRALAEGRSENIRLFSVMKQYFPGFQNARIRKIYDAVGVRETRRIKGHYNISIEDAVLGKQYEDTVAATTYNFDLLDPVKIGHDNMMGDAKNPNAVRKHVVIRIPYRSMLPQNADNLIVAGRCISCHREVMGAVRVMGPCMMLGQAAGTAAALAMDAKLPYCQVDVNKLKAELYADGVKNPEDLAKIFDT